MAVYYVDADELDGIANATSGARNDLYWALKPLEAGQWAVSWQRDTQGQWNEIRRLVNGEIGLLDSDARALRDRAGRVRIAAAEGALGDAVEWLRSLIARAGEGASYIGQQLAATPQFLALTVAAFSTEVGTAINRVQDLAELSVPRGTWRTFESAGSIILPGAAIGAPTSSVELGYRKIVKIRRLADGSAEIYVEYQYDAAAVQKLTPEARAGLGIGSLGTGYQLESREGAYVKRVWQFQFADAEDLEKNAVFAAALTDHPDILDLAAATFAKDDLTQSKSGLGFKLEASAEIGNIAEASATAQAGIGTDYQVTDAGFHESALLSEAEVSGMVRFLGASGAVTAEAEVARVLVSETGKSYTRITIEVQSHVQGELLSAAYLEQELGIKTTMGGEAYRSFEIEISVDDAAVESQQAIARGDFQALLRDAQSRSHVVITGHEVEQTQVGVEFEVTPVPTQTIGASVDLSLGQEKEVVILDNGYRLQAYSQ